MPKVDIRHGYYGIVTYDSNGKEKCFTKVGKAITLKKIYIDFETDHITWELSFEYRRQKVTVNFDRENIGDKASIKQLLAKGADIKPQNINMAISSIMMQEESVKKEFSIYKNVGWKNLAINVFADDYVYRGNTLVGDGEGIYQGNYQLEPQGSFEGWQKMVRNEILGHQALEVIMLASLSAVVNGLIATHTTGENPIFHINAPTGKGKSSVGFAACSVFGEPFDGCKSVVDENGNFKTVKSIYGSWSATANAVIRSHVGNQGMVIILNELGKFEGEDLTSIVYSLSEGTDKNRLNEKYESIIGEGFATSIISIGESSMIQRCKTKEGGIDIRVMEIEDDMTVDADHSRRLKEGSRKNNGWAGSKLAQYILNSGGLDFVLKTFKDTLEELSADVKESGKHRYIEKFTALLVTTAKISSEALELDFDIPAVIEFCDRYWNNKTDEKGSVSKSYDEIIEYCNTNIAGFLNNNPKHLPKEILGRVVYPNIVVGNKVLVTEFWIRPNKMKEMFGIKGYKNATTQLKIWREKGVLDCDQGHLSNKRKIDVNGKEERAYVVQVWGEISAIQKSTAVQQGGRAIKKKTITLSQNLTVNKLDEREDGDNVA